MHESNKESQNEEGKRKGRMERDGGKTLAREIQGGKEQKDRQSDLSNASIKITNKS